MLPQRVTIVEVGPRDGLQNEARPVATADKAAFVRRLEAAGVRELEVTSFVSPRWVPQLADATELLGQLRRPAGVRHHALVPNVPGLERLLALPDEARPQEVVVFGAASEMFSRRNLNCGIDESIERFAPVVARAHAAGLVVRGAVSCALGCPFEGPIAPAAVGRVVGLMRGIGVDHVGLADTIGVGTPGRVREVVEAAAAHYPLTDLSGHFHDTYGQALANILACLDLGLARFDASVAGLGGCPYAPGATGNVATEDVVYLLHGLGIDTGIDLDALADAGAWISERLGRPSASRAGTALHARRRLPT
ncbi:MAG: hydroxymethylglutaryl-CoA lyase [Gemmatimonadales bacterium]|nr:hydroxymethylglutaryl-CoA lyase [Gemmatimonadales bacterium]